MSVKLVSYSKPSEDFLEEGMISNEYNLEFNVFYN